MANEEYLVPELRDWRTANDETFSIDDWLASKGTMSLAIGYSRLFWPDFIEHQGCVFFKTHFSEDNFIQWTQASVSNFAEIERVINHIHILDLFSYEKQQPITYEQVIYLGRVLKDIYHTKLKALFPEKTFQFFFEEDETYEDLLDYQLTFHQPLNENRAIR